MVEDEIVLLGKITSAFGIKGGIKVHSFSKPRANILNYSSWLLKIDGKWQPTKLLSGKEQDKTITVQLEGIKDRSQAELLNGTEIAVYASQLPEVGHDEYYWRDLEGMKVTNLEGVEFGVVSHLIETGANDVLVVKQTAEQALGKKRQERMIPFTEHAVKEINRTEQSILVDWDEEF